MNLNKGTDRLTSIPLDRWIARTYLRSAIIPLFLVELTFLAIFWMSSNFIYDRNAAALGNISKSYMGDLARREGSVIGQSLGRVQDLTTLLSRQTRHALATPHPPSAREMRRYGPAPNGSFASLFGDDGEAAGYYSALQKIGPEQRDKIWRTSRLDPLLRDLKASNPLITQVYFNSWDSYNRIYPYFDTWRQYPARMAIDRVPPRGVSWSA